MMAITLVNALGIREENFWVKGRIRRCQLLRIFTYTDYFRLGYQGLKSALQPAG